MGSVSSGWFRYDEDFRKRMVMAGAAAGICALFNSPLGGLLFALEVMAISISFRLMLLLLPAVAGAMLVTYVFNQQALVAVYAQEWSLKSLPFYLLFALPVALISVYLTKAVIITKSFFVRKTTGVSRVLIGGLIVGVGVFLIWPLYGEGYGTSRLLLAGDVVSFVKSLGSFTIQNQITTMLLVLLLLLIKPIITSVTLAAGGDGGVFAPSLFLGAAAGFLFSYFLNSFGFDLNVVNFVIVGMAALLGGSIHAPLTGVFLAMSFTQSYWLMPPMLITTYSALWMVKRLLPYTVYSYAQYNSSDAQRKVI